ncbi:hypothetical protein V8B97DRAFT_1980016 [Scleroderma yunnanense]
MAAQSILVGIFRYFKSFLLDLAKRYSPTHLLRYLLALWSTATRACRPKCNDKDLKVNHGPISLSMSPTVSEEKESSVSRIKYDTVRHVTVSDAENNVIRGRLHEPIEGSRAQTPGVLPVLKRRCNPPLKEGAVLTRCPTLLDMLFMLDHPGFIRRSLAATQVTENREHFTDVKKWHDFSLAYREDIANVNLLGTVLLATNVSFLAIQSIDNAGLSYLPQKFSYMSLLAALASIMMGSAVRIPRLFTGHNASYFRAMVYILGFPFELFLYSILFFILALVTHCIHHAATTQLVCASILGLLVLLCLVGYWLITEPCNDVNSTTPGECPTGTPQVYV